MIKKGIQIFEFHLNQIAPVPGLKKVKQFTCKKSTVSSEEYAPDLVGQTRADFMKKINNAVGSIGRSRPEPGMIKNLHFTDKNEQRMVTHPIFFGRVISFSSSLLIAVNRLYGGVCIQGDGIKSGLIQPTGIVVQQHGLQSSCAALAKLFKR